MSGSDEIAEIEELEARLAELKKADSYEARLAEAAAAKTAADTTAEDEAAAASKSVVDATEAADAAEAKAKALADEAKAKAEALARQKLADYRRERTIGGVSIGEGQIQEMVDDERDLPEGGGLKGLIQVVGGIAAVVGLIVFSQIPVGESSSSIQFGSTPLEKVAETPNQIAARYAVVDEEISEAEEQLAALKRKLAAQQQQQQQQQGQQEQQQQQ